MQEPAPKRQRLDLIYGDDGHGSLMFIERAIANENLAFRKAKTWGDVRANAPMIYERAWHGDDLPADDEFVDHADHYERMFFPQQLMLSFMPATIQERFGEAERTAFDGPVLSLSPKHEINIVKALRDEGHTVERNDSLVIEALGY